MVWYMDRNLLTNDKISRTTDTYTVTAPCSALMLRTDYRRTLLVRKKL